MKLAILALGVFLLWVGAACGGSGDDNTPTPDVCSQKAALEASIKDLTAINVVSAGTDALHQALNKVQADATALKQVASADLSDEVDALQTAVSDAGGTLNSLESADTVNQKIDQLQGAFTQVATAATALDQALSKECG